MNQQIEQQERIQALVVQAQWFQAVMFGLAAAGVVIFTLPKILKPEEEKK